MKIVAEKTKYHRFSLYFDYDRDKVEFCRDLKDSFGWDQFSFDNQTGIKRWIFSDSLLVSVLQERFPETQIDPMVQKIMVDEQQWIKSQTEKTRMIDEVREKKDTDFHIKGLKKELYPYQKVGVEFLTVSGGRAIVADSMGLGKTIESIAYAKHQGYKRILVVCPASVKFTWEAEVKKWTNMTSFIINSQTDLSVIDPDINYWIINYDLLRKHYAQLSKIHFDMLCGDEAQYCFPGDTMINTECGQIPIKDIVEQRMDLNVASCNSLSTEVEYKHIIGYQKNEQIIPSVKITHEQGSFICTGNHKIYTDSGWKEAVFLRKEDGLRILPRKFYNFPKGEKCCKTMQSEVCGSLGEQLSSNKKSNQWPKSPKSGNSVCVVQKKEDKGNESSIKKRTNTSILWEVLFGKVADYSTMGKREFTQSDKNSAKVQNREKISTNIDINEKEKQGSKVQEEITNRIFKMEKEKSDISPSWWKWFYNSTPKNIVKINRNEDGISDKNQTRSWGISLIANSLQSRLSQYWKKSSGGSRWKFPLIKKVEVLGQKKDKSTQISRVVSVEVLEQGSNGRSSKNSRQDSFVYNIEVEGNHNYFANGVLVANCKSIKAIRTKAFRAISRNIHSVVLLSGTPLLSRPSELFSLLNIIDPKTWNNWYDFARKYCNMRQTRWGVDTSGASNTEELHARIKRYFIRREKSEVLKELPPKNFIDVPIELTGDSLTEYSEAAKDLAFYLRRYVGKQPPEIAKALAAEKLTQLNVLRQLCALGKIDTAIELIENIVDSGEKVLVFSSFVEPLARLQAHFGSKSVLLTGQTPVADRQGIVESFQGDKNVQVFLGGYKSAGIGLTLTAASNFLGLDYPWNPADLSQSIDRLHRPGQKAESVNVYQITAKDTIDEDMKETLDRKQNIFDQVIDGKVEDKVASETMEKAVDRVLKNY